MFVMVLRIILLALFAYCIYAVVKYVANPKRRLKLAQSKEHFYIIDEQNNTRKNFQLTYKGVLFEGEKNIPSKDHPLFIHTIFVWTESPEKLKHFSAKDFENIEEKVLERYPNCKIDWDQPIKLAKKAEER
ncbi:sigma W pathway protein YsdB [Bacillus subtilis subsp. subtilis]|uniref:sigma W pathway protein YsdB n=1 Tax=Bacillus subtilis TaxID=1423 RepID=UPI000EF2778E|nr:sigma W pathway protein YsdB [Bacillus subtilis]AYK57970.1 sigma W pathway protein YsdB [Bacillus subtilis subsp. subtilis]